MALKHHTDSDLRISQQVENSENYVLAFINETYKVVSGLKVLEIGCGEGGVLKPFIDRGCNCVGVDLDDVRIDIANDIFKNEVNALNLRLSHLQFMLPPGHIPIHTRPGLGIIMKAS